MDFKKNNNLHIKSDELGAFIDFFNQFEDHNGRTIYRDVLQNIANSDERTLYVYLDHIAQFFQNTNNHDLPQRIEQNTFRYQGVAALASDRCMPPPSTTTIENANVGDLYTKQRREMIEQARAQGLEINSVPLQLLQSHVVHFLPLSTSQPLPLRRVGADHMGSLVTIQGLVVKVSDVQPTVQVQTYICNVCGYESYQSIDLAAHYAPLQQCPSPLCVANQSKGDLRQQLRSSKLVPQQTVVLQELQHEVPVGGVARTMKLIASSHDLVHVVKPGSLVTVSGIYLPEHFAGFRQIRAGLLSDQYILLKSIHVNKKSYQQMGVNDEMTDMLNGLSQLPNVYEKLANFISPEIYGHNDTKKALLLSMIGGVTRTMSDGMKIRGDVNVMLVGDPGMAKSQILKYVHTLAPRSVYTTGKGASGVGLTAAVQRDTKTGEISLEGGALVLADMGICCIDEFDKMGEEDRTAIHEVMEQQTVSISKAGITTSLNARTTVIAAANPAFGRYNVARSLSENMNMPPALLSRFDLIFVLLDKPDLEIDLALAKHITYVHKYGRPPRRKQDIDDESGDEFPLTNDIFRHYIARAKECIPNITPEVVDYITNCYVQLRSSSNAEDMTAQSNTSNGNSRERFCTARQLLGIIRIAQGHAKLHFRDQVLKQDVDEALRLLTASKSEIALTSKQQQTTGNSIPDRLLDLFKAEAKKDPKHYVPKSSYQAIALVGSFSKEDVDNFYQQYTQAGVLVEMRNGLGHSLVEE